MDELGTILRETREARELTLEQVAQVTRIRPRFLEALEEGRYDALPTPVHVRGYLRNYALHLGLDPAPLIARYKASRRVVQDIPLERQVRPELEKAAQVPLETFDDELESGPVFYRPLGSRLLTPAWFSSDVLIGGVIVVVLLGFVIWAGGRFLGPIISGARETDTPVAEVTGTRAIPTVSTVVIQSATPTASRPAQEATIPPIVSSVTLEIAVLERSWLAVEVNGQVVQEGMARQGDIFAWDGAELVKLRTGNGAGLDVTLNGQNLGALGARGQVVEKIWGLDGEIPPTPAPTATPAPTETPSATPEG